MPRITKCKDEQCQRMVAGAHNTGRTGYCRVCSSQRGLLGHSEDWKKQMSERLKGNIFALGNHTLKPPFSEEHLKHMSECKRGKRKGAENNLWKGGITSVHRKIRASIEYAEWRKKVFQRDGYECIWCGAKNGNGKTIPLQADHIKPFALYPKLRFVLSNGRTLCKSCHMRTPTHGRFKKLLTIKPTISCV